MSVLKLLNSRRPSAGTEIPRGRLATPPPESFPVLSAQELLALHQQLVGQMRQQAGVPVAHWNALYEHLLHNFASFVQQLPASEAHHHRDAGGLLQHGLDTALKALTIRRGVLLPTGATSEHLANKQDVWTYATATAALLHDLGKPVVDQAVALFDADGQAAGSWNPLAGPIPATAAAYAVSFVRGRRYRLHPRLPPLLVQFIVPPIGLEWITKDLDVFEAWLATISGGDSEFAGELGQIIKQADGLSVAADLAPARAQTVTAGHAPRSLGERLAVALRHLVDSQAFPLNRPGAAGWVIGDDLWLVSKRVLDALRDQLAQDSGGGTAPRNERLMDELQQHGIVMSNGDRAIWAATVELAGWQQRLTLLRVPVARLWIDPASRPAAVVGRVVPESDTAPTTVPPEMAAQPVPQMPTATSPVAPARDGDVDLYAGLPLPPMRDSAATIPGAESTAVTNAGTAQGQAAPSTETATVQDNDFLHWIREGVAAGRLKVNTVDARLHVTREGVLLVSPGVFRDFAGVEGWAAAQKKLQKLKLHLKTPEGTNIWTYRVSGERKSSAQLKGLVIPGGASLLGLKLPDPNPHLSLVLPGPTANVPATEAAEAGP